MEYSKVVRILKVGLPIIAVVFTLLVLFWPDRHQKIRTETGQVEDRELLHLINARFLTSDKKNQPIALTAERAQEASLGSNIVNLENLKADIQLQNKNFIMAEAKQGTFNRSTNIMQTQTPMIVTTDSGYKLSIRRAIFNLDKRTLFGGKTSGFGPMGEGLSGSVHYYDKQQLLVLKTNPKITLKNTKRETVISADTISFLLKKDEIDAEGGVKVTLDETSEFTADKTKVIHEVKDKKKTVKYISSGQNVVFKTVAQTATGDTMVFKAKEDLAILKGHPVVLTMDGMEIRTPEIHYSPSELLITAVNGVKIRRADDSTIEGNVMKVFLDKDHQPVKMEGIGNIIARTETETLTADFAVYYFETEILRAEHNILLVRGPNSLKGDFATMDLKNGISMVEMTEDPVEVIIDPKDESLKDAGQSFQKEVKEKDDPEAGNDTADNENEDIPSDDGKHIKEDAHETEYETDEDFE